MSVFTAFRRDLKGLGKYYSLSQWMMRIFVFLYIFVNYNKRIMYFDFSSEYFFLGVFYISCSGLILLGGFSRTSEMTRLAAFFMALVLIAHTAASFFLFRSIDAELVNKLLLLGVLLYFVTVSKKNDYHWRSRHERDTIDIEEFIEKKE